MEAPAVDWAALPASVDPARGGGLGAKAVTARGLRKRAQVESVYALLHTMLQPLHVRLPPSLPPHLNQPPLVVGGVRWGCWALRVVPHDSLSNMRCETDTNEQALSFEGSRRRLSQESRKVLVYPISHERTSILILFSSGGRASQAAGESVRVVEMGCGSGNVALALAALLPWVHFTLLDRNACAPSPSPSPLRRSHRL